MWQGPSEEEKIMIKEGFYSRAVEFLFIVGGIRALSYVIPYVADKVWKWKVGIETLLNNNEAGHTNNNTIILDYKLWEENSNSRYIYRYAPSF